MFSLVQQGQVLARFEYDILRTEMVFRCVSLSNESLLRPYTICISFGY